MIKNEIPLKKIEFKSLICNFLIYYCKQKKTTFKNIGRVQLRYVLRHLLRNLCSHIYNLFVLYLDNQ